MATAKKAPAQKAPAKKAAPAKTVTAKKAAPSKTVAAKKAVPAKKRTPNPAFMKALTLSPELSAVVGDKPYASLVPSPEYKQFRERRPDVSPIGNVRKCTFCLHLQDENGEYDKAAGRWPACAKTCTGKAIQFGDFLDPDSEVSRLTRERQSLRMKEELGAEPNVHYLV